MNYVTFEPIQEENGITNTSVTLQVIAGWYCLN